MMPSWYTPPPFRVVSPRQILERIARLHDVSVSDILGRSRRPHHCAARWAVMSELRARRWSTSEIGALLRRDHATVMHGLRRAV